MIADPPRSLFVILIALTIAFAARLAVWQSRRALIYALIPGGFLLALYLTDRLIETPREESSRRMEAMATAATAIDTAKFMEHVSESFDEGGRGKRDLQNSPAWNLIRQYQARIVVWDFNRNSYKEINDAEIEIGFRAKASDPEGRFIEKYVKARFVRDGDQQWRLKGIKFFNPLNPEEAAPIPGFP